MRRFTWMAGYLGTAVLGLALAYSISTRFLAPARAQSGAPAPNDGSLPAEFLKEVDSGAAPEAGKGTAPAAPNKNAPPPNSGTPPKSAAPMAAPAPFPAGNVGKAAPAATPTAVTPPAAPSATQTAPPTTNPAPSAGTAGGNEDYVYDPTGRRDPFHPYRAIREERQSSRAASEDLEPLQRYDIENLTIMGIMWDVHQPRALVKDSDGNMHTVVKNTKMGRSNGYVAAIREGELVLVEVIEDEGRSVKRTRVMELKK